MFYIEYKIYAVKIESQLDEISERTQKDTINK